MARGFKRDILTVTLGQDGPKRVKAYIKGGLGVIPVSDSDAWTVIHVAGDAEIYYGLHFPTLRAAKGAAEDLLALDVDWTLSPGDEFERQFQLAADRILDIAGECREFTWGQRFFVAILTVIIAIPTRTWLAELTGLPVWACIVLVLPPTFLIISYVVGKCLHADYRE